MALSDAVNTPTAGPEFPAPGSELTLAQASVGQSLTLRRAEGSPDFCRRLAALGLRRGARISVVQRTAGGGRIIAVAGGRIALDKSVLDRLFAEVSE